MLDEHVKGRQQRSVRHRRPQICAPKPRCGERLSPARPTYQPPRRKSMTGSVIDMIRRSSDEALALHVLEVVANLAADVVEARVVGWLICAQP